MAITRLGPNQDITAAKIAGQINFKNIIINGDMSIAQRGAGPSGTFAGSGFSEGPDRYEHILIGLGTWQSSQSTDVPSGQGFSSSFRMNCISANASAASNDNIYVRQKIEAQNLQHLKYGTSSAESLTLSFWVKSTKTGTFVVWLYQDDDTRSVAKSYTVNSSDTWEKKTITFDGDTTGIIDNDNGSGIRVNFFLGAGTDWTSGTLATSWEADTKANRAVGQVNCADSTSNNWYITGVQLEVGTTASDFEFLPYDVNLRRCQRYYFVINQSGANGGPLHPGRTNGAADINNIGVACPVPLRIGNPSVTIQSGTIMQVWANTFSMTSAGGGSVTSLVNTGSDSIRLMLNVNGFSGLSNGVAANWGPVISGMPVDAEL